MVSKNLPQAGGVRTQAMSDGRRSGVAPSSSKRDPDHLPAYVFGQGFLRHVEPRCHQAAPISTMYHLVPEVVSHNRNILCKSRCRKFFLCVPDGMVRVRPGNHLRSRWISSPARQLQHPFGIFNSGMREGEEDFPGETALDFHKSKG